MGTHQNWHPSGPPDTTSTVIFCPSNFLLHFLYSAKALNIEMYVLNVCSKLTPAQTKGYIIYLCNKSKGGTFWQKKGNFTRNTWTGVIYGSTQTNYYHTTFILNKISKVSPGRRGKQNYDIHETSPSTYSL
ncbi:hypothetical protein llap_14004 [Limosa lapponica baueri]|uniref:Uncharacterized protein n=1 Tax=Limosa lapponica baueri TaxID=1758121 RepID=A0A2I0TPI3_LIMLA|nr:hypothetical protein llap_14004 [Limosa lapponica baueri]